MQRLFSYGTLRNPQVQQDTFGRLLECKEDFLSGYQLSQLQITDPKVLASSGEQFHPMISFTGDNAHKVSGVRVKITEQELQAADAYEVDDYKRVRVTLDSGVAAWVYVNATDDRE